MFYLSSVSSDFWFDFLEGLEEIRICMLFVLMQINFKVLSKLQNIPDSKRIGENFVISPTLQLSVHQINYWTLGWTGKR